MVAYKAAGACEYDDVGFCDKRVRVEWDSSQAGERTASQSILLVVIDLKISP